MTRKVFATTLVAALAMLAQNAGGQISITSGNLSYSQDWGTGYATGIPAWVDNSVFPGWYAYQHGTANAPPNYYITNTTALTATGRFYLIAATSDPANFGFGGRVTDATSGAPSNPDSGYYLGLRLSNDTGDTLDGFSLGYTGAQFAKAANANANSLTVSYQIGTPANLVDGTWNAISSLTFTGPKADTGTATGLDFNDPSNQTVFSPVTISGLSWAAGTDLWVRFKINNVGGTDHGLLIDNINFVAVPEPTAAALMALGLAALVSRLRSRK